MIQNIGTLERVLRVAVGIVFLALSLKFPTAVWGLIGIYPLVTGALGFDALYEAAGISARPARIRRPAHTAARRAQA